MAHPTQGYSTTGGVTYYAVVTAGPYESGGITPIVNFMPFAAQHMHLVLQGVDPVDFYGLNIYIGTAAEALLIHNIVLSGVGGGARHYDYPIAIPMGSKLWAEALCSDVTTPGNYLYLRATFLG